MPHCTWHDEKAALNFKKHGVTFHEAATLFKSRLTLTYFDDVDPEREHAIGPSNKNNMLLVVFIEFVEEDVVRIISARHAEASERRKYEEWRKHAHEKV
jgi:hypothetical protein